MRQATFDRKAVLLPNSRAEGFSKWKARPGDLVVFWEGQQKMVARVIARVAYSPGGPTMDPVKNHLFVIALSVDLGFVMVRWVDPAQVTECYWPQHPDKDMQGFYAEHWAKRLALLGQFLAPDLGQARGQGAIDELCHWAHSGYSTLADYRARAGAQGPGQGPAGKGAALGVSRAAQRAQRAQEVRK